MPKKYRKPYMTDRDIEMVKWIAEQNVVRFDTIHSLMNTRYNPINKSLMYALCDKWYRLGFIKKQKLLGNAPTILWATTKALKLAGFSVGHNERIQSPSFSNLLHDCAVSAVRLEYEANGAEWICERRLRSEMKGEHLPDGIAIINSSRIVVEIDRTRKRKSRLELIMLTNARIPGVVCVDYWAPQNLLEFIKEQINNLDIGIRDKVRLFELPKGVNL